MIDVEIDIFDQLSTALTEAFPEVDVESEYNRSPDTFPHVSIVEMENSFDEERRSSSGVEEYANLTYEVNIYSNKLGGRKAECRAIANAIDEHFCRLGFSRVMLEPIDNLMDTTIYRMLGRYTAKVSKDNVIYRR